MKKYKELLKKDLVDNLDCELKFDTSKLESNKKSKFSIKGLFAILFGSVSLTFSSTICCVLIVVLMIPVLAFARIKEKPRMYEISYRQSELDAIEEGSFIKLNEIQYPSLEIKDNSLVSDEYKIAVNDFAYNLYLESIDEYQNTIISPLSLYSLLDIVSSGTSNQSISHLFDLTLNLDFQTRYANYAKMYENNYYLNDDGTIQMYNGMFFNNRYNYNEEFVNEITEKYVEAYQLDLSKNEDVDKMLTWANEKVQEEDFIKYQDLNIEEDTEMYAFSTFYFNNKWSNKYSKKDTYKDNFYLSDGTTEQVKYMTHSYNGLVYDYDEYYALYDYYKNGSKIKYILPKEEIDVFEIAKKNNILIDDKNYLADTSWGNGYLIINLEVPKFNYEYSIDYSYILSKMGLDVLFDKNVNSFDRMFKDYPSDINFYLQTLKQKNKINFNEDGTEVKTITMASFGAGSSAPLKTLDAKLNRPFIYIIYDSNDLPLYIGSYVNP